MHAGMAVGATKIDRLRATNEGEEKLLCQELAKIERQRRKRLRGLLRVQANLRSEVFRRQSEAFILQQEERTLRAKIDDLVFSLVKRTLAQAPTPAVTEHETTPWRPKPNPPDDGKALPSRSQSGKSPQWYDNNRQLEQDKVRHQLELEARQNARSIRDSEAAVKISNEDANNDGKTNTGNITMTGEGRDPCTGSGKTSIKSSDKELGETSLGDKQPSCTAGSENNLQCEKARETPEQYSDQESFANVRNEMQRKCRPLSEPATGYTARQPVQLINPIPRSHQDSSTFRDAVDGEKVCTPSDVDFPAKEAAHLPSYYPFKAPAFSYNNNSSKGFTRVGVRPVTAAFQRSQEISIARNRPLTAASRRSTPFSPFRIKTAEVQRLRNNESDKMRQKSLEAILQIRKAVSASARTRAERSEYLSQEQQEAGLNRHELVMKARKQRQKLENDRVTERVWKFIGTRPLSVSLHTVPPNRWHPHASGARFSASANTWTAAARHRNPVAFEK